MTMSRGGVRPPPVCADCSAPDPTWASVNRGVLICDECCSVHRSLGRHISIVKSLKKGQWSPSQHAMVYLLATSGANNIWEHTMLDPSQNRHGRKKPGPRDPLHPNKSDFIRAKYQFLSFINKQKDSEASSLDDVSKELHSSVRTNNVETCLRLLSKGADPNYFYREKGNCPMHVAAQGGQTAQIELLAVYGADPGVRDANGRTPVDYANKLVGMCDCTDVGIVEILCRSEGFTDLADRLVELQYELTDRLSFYICGRKPDHRVGQHFKIPQLGDHTADLSDLAKQAKKKLQDLPNHLFEELAMDVYDEVDRRENDSIWLSTHDHTSIVSERLTVPHLPVNPELSTTRNQGRQKLARFNNREFATLVMDILNDARLRQTGMIQTPKEPDKFTGMKLLKRPQSKTISALSDEEPLYDSVASDEDYSSIDSQSIRSMQIELKEDMVGEALLLTDRSNTPTSVISFTENIPAAEVEGPVTTEEFLNIRRALAESQAKVQQLVQAKTDLEKHLSEMHSKMESLMMENQTLRIHRDSLMVDHVTSSLNGQAHDSETEHMRPQMRPQVRPTSMIEMRDASRQLAQSSPVSSGQLSGASSVSNISMTVAGQEQVSSDLEDQLNANVLEVIDDLPDAILSEAYDPPRSVASQVYEPPKPTVSQGFHPPLRPPPGFEPIKAVAHSHHEPPKSMPPHHGDPAKAAVSQGFNPPRVAASQSSGLERSKALSQAYEAPQAGIPSGYDPTRAVSQGYTAPRVPVSQGYELPRPMTQPPMSVIPPGYDPARGSLSQGFAPPKAINSQGHHHPPQAVSSQCYDLSGVILSQGFIPVRPAVSQGYDPTRAVVSQGYDPARAVVSQGYDPTRAVVSQGYDPTRAVVYQGYDPTRAVVSQGYDPARAVVSQGFDPARAVVSQGYDPARAAVSQGCDPTRATAPQGYDPQRTPVSHGFEPPKVPANPVVSQTYDPLRASVGPGYDNQRVPLSQVHDPQNVIISQGQDLPRPVVSHGYSPPVIPPGYELQKPAISQPPDLTNTAVSQSFDSPKANVSQGYEPAKVVSQGSDPTVVSQGHDPANEHITQPPCVRPEGVVTQSHDSPTPSVCSIHDVPSTAPAIPVGFDPPTTTTTPPSHDSSSEAGYPSTYDPSSSVHPPGFQTPPPVIALGYDTPNVVLSQGCDVPSAVVSQGYEAPSAVLPQGYGATAVSAPQATSVTGPETNGVPQGFSSAPASLSELAGQEVQSLDRDSPETDDQESTCSQTGAGGEGEKEGEEGKEDAATAAALLPVMPTQEEVVRKTEKVTKKIQELLQTAQEGNHNSFAPCSERIHVAVRDMAALFPGMCPTPKVQETLEQLTVSALHLREECKDWPPSPDHEPQPDFRLKTQQVIQFAYDIAKAAKRLVTLFQ